MTIMQKVLFGCGIVLLVTAGIVGYYFYSRPPRPPSGAFPSKIGRFTLQGVPSSKVPANFSQCVSHAALYQVENSDDLVIFNLFVCPSAGDATLVQAFLIYGMGGLATPAGKSEVRINNAGQQTGTRMLLQGQGNSCLVVGSAGPWAFSINGTLPVAQEFEKALPY